MDDDVFGQHSSRLRLDWGLAGARAMASPGADQGRVLFVVVDVLSFSTAVSVAAERGIEVLPFPWRDDRAAEHARRHQAVLARARSERDVSLSPTSLQNAPGLERVVLPSPNGSTIALSLAESGGTVVTACLRNARAVGEFARRFLDRAPGRAVAIVAGGERRPDGSLRPAVEDLWGAGAVADAIVGHDDEASPEAEMAAAAYRSARDRGPGTLHERLSRCVSGRELITQGFGSDVEIAAEVDVSHLIPVLEGGRFVGQGLDRPG
ncbi:MULTISPECIES: 2-phosphosulfolactate phosphatase [Oerskovia]|uniref:2-phosphosulfolactate phosphatase n=1 Tax=Oerskovia TaxID=162491 RepID=UPI0006F2E318|nr:2-phosphosulfolactate phosphatase [Oerskovia sp. Root22]KRC35611.1 hypothetical protein ASE15_10830 [Oerskovia sp. Root22]